MAKMLHCPRTDWTKRKTRRRRRKRRRRKERRRRRRKRVIGARSPRLRASP
jgi:hypothetical protein